MPLFPVISIPAVSLLDFDLLFNETYATVTEGIFDFVGKVTARAYGHILWQIDVYLSLLVKMQCQRQGATSMILMDEFFQLLEFTAAQFICIQHDMSAVGIFFLCFG